MVTKRVRNYKDEYKRDRELGKDGPNSDQGERQKARRMYDKMGIDRSGKDIDHIKPLRKGGTSSKSNLRLRGKKANQGDNKWTPYRHRNLRTCGTWSLGTGGFRVRC